MYLSPPPGLQDPLPWPPAKTVPGPPREGEPCLSLASVQMSTGTGLRGWTGHAVVLAFGGRLQKCLFQSWDCICLFVLFVVVLSNCRSFLYILDTSLYRLHGLSGSPQPPGHGVEPVHGLLGTGPHGSR